MRALFKHLFVFILFLLPVFSVYYAQYTPGQKEIKDVVLIDLNSENSRRSSYKLSEQNLHKVYMLSLHYKHVRSYLTHKNSNTLGRLGEEIGYFKEFRLTRENSMLVANFVFYNSYIDHNREEYELLMEIIDETPSLAAISMTSTTTIPVQTLPQTLPQTFNIVDVVSFDWVTRGAFTDYLRYR